MSIKNKFVTAITTAGLLAGLFGSAFVPSALASRAIDTDESYAFVQNSGNALGGLIGLNTDQASGHRNDYNTIGGYYGSADFELPNKLQISSWVNYGNNSGSGEGPSGTTGFTDGDDFSIGFYLETEGGAAIESADLTATVSGGKVEVAFAYPANGRQRVACYNPDLQGSFGSTGDSVNDAISDGVDSLEASAGYYYLCVKAVSETTLGTSNVVIKADGVTIWSGSIQVIGDLDEMNISIRDGHPHVAAGNNEDSLFFKVVMEDAAGQAICGTRDGFNNDCEDDVLAFSEPSYVARGANPDDIFAGFEIGQDSEATLAADVCLDADAGDTKTAAIRTNNYDGDQITSNTISITCTEAQTEFVVASTGITQEYANPTLTGEAVWADSAQGEDDVTGDIEIYAVIKDSNGLLMGVDDSSGFYAGMDYEIDGNSDLYIDDQVGNAGGIRAGGKVVLGHYNPAVETAAKFEIEVTFADGNGATALNQAVAKSLYYLVSSLDLDVTLTRVRNASKTSATWTADWGLDCSNAVVYFDWVNKNGTKGTLATGVSPIARRANFDGVATFTLKKRNMTIYVTAYACDDFSDSPDELGPVKARFR
jgi:hypothetical protein